MINLTFPDGAVRQVQAGTSGGQLAASISKSLEKKAVALIKDGAVDRPCRSHHAGCQGANHHAR